MAKTALEDTHYELIKAHILTPEQSPLNHEQKEILERVISVAKILDKNPIQKNAVALHMKKFPHIGRTRAHLDVRLAIKLFNTYHNFDYDFWQTWQINDIVENIRRARSLLAEASNEKQQGALLRVIAMEHANLIRAIGDKPSAVNDPRLTEKHEYYVLIQQQNNQTVKIDYSMLKTLPEATRRELNQAIFGGREIKEEDAIEIMKS